MIQQALLATGAAAAVWMAVVVIAPASDSQAMPAAQLQTPSTARPPMQTAANGQATPLAASQAKHGSVVQPAEQAAQALWDDVLRQSGLDAQWLQSHGFTAGSAALQQLHGLLNGQTAIASSGTVVPIAFGPQGRALQSAAIADPALSSHERFVDATLATADMAGDSVLLRWRNASDNAVLHLAAQPLTADTSGNMPLWMYSPADWAPGSYRVEVLSADPSLTLLAAGQFQIAVPGAAVTAFSYEAQAPLQQ